MNPFIESFDSTVESEPEYTQAQEEELLDHILEHSCYTDLEKFTIDNIAYYDALNTVQSDDDYPADAISFLLDNGHSLPITFESSNKIAYDLAYNNPEVATALLDELLYYRKLGRI